MNPLDEREPLLQPLKEDKYVFTAGLQEHDDIYQLYKKQQSCFWTPPEVDFGDDAKAFEAMSEGEQRFISYVVAFFAGSDLIVNENISTRFCEDIEVPIILTCYHWQMAMEDIHSETYSILLQTIVPKKEEQRRLMHAISEIDTIKQKADFCFKYMNCDCQFKYRLIAFAICEGVFFSSSFAAIFWLKSKGGRMSGLITSNEFISRDEGMHCEMAVLLYKKLKYPLSQKEIHAMYRKGADIEKAFICDAVPCALMGMNSSTMCEYIEFVCDFWLVQLGYDKLYGTPNPFPFMEAISLESKTNFFEKRVTSYSLAEKDHTFNCDDDDF